MSDSEQTAMNLLRGLNELRKEGTFCDVTLRVGERTINVHKNVISASSLYFLTILLQSDQQEITLEDIDADCFELLIEYMYSGTLNIDFANVKDLLLTAIFLQMTSAEELCFDFIEEVLNVENFIEYILFAKDKSIERLVEISLRYAVAWFHDIFPRKEYLELEFEELKELTEMLKQKGHPEDIIFSFVLCWINNSPETRTRFMEELLELMDPLLISPSIFHSSEILNIPNPVFTAWANGAHCLNKPADYILLLAEYNSCDPLRINIFSEAEHRQIESLPEDIYGGSYVCHGYYIFHHGGYKNCTLGTQSYVYHPTKRAWNSFIPLQQARAVHSSCVLNGKIFSVGGLDDERTLESVEFIDLYTGQSGFANPLPRAKWQPGLGLYENSIFVIGGRDSGNRYECTHRLDLREGVWQALAPSPYGAGANSCAVIGDDIFTTNADTLQRYDIRANHWEMISTEDKKYPREVFALHGSLFGLFDDHIANFILEEGKWEIQRSWNDYQIEGMSTNLLFPNVNEEDIKDPVFKGKRKPLQGRLRNRGQRPKMRIMSLT